jgi:hypothetical protein
MHLSPGLRSRSDVAAWRKLSTCGVGAVDGLSARVGGIFPPCRDLLTVRPISRPSHLCGRCNSYRQGTDRIWPFWMQTLCLGLRRQTAG